MDRRFHRPPLESPLRISCRVCFTRVGVEPDVVEPVDGWYVLHCPAFGGSFPVRREDLSAAEVEEHSGPD